MSQSKEIAKVQERRDDRPLSGPWHQTPAGEASATPADAVINEFGWLTHQGSDNATNSKP